MKLVVDENIAYAEETFSGYGEVILSHGRKITNAMLHDADALIVRSITKVNQELLHDTKVKFVGTATIGVDHVDLDYLAEQGIAFSDAKGCNADAVTEYVYTLIAKFLVDNGWTPRETTLGIIGRGNIGSRIAKLAPYLGLKVLVNDPPLQRQGVRYPFASLEDTLQADILTIHTPLTMTGKDKTFHLLSRGTLGKARNIKFLINASRGETADKDALLVLTTERRIPLALDVWENEPHISADILNAVKYASPHIAGYSLEGKINGTMIMKQALDAHLNRTDGFMIASPPVVNNHIVISSERPIIEILNAAAQFVYNIEKDTALLKKGIAMDEMTRGKYFDTLRKEYELRREFTNYTIELRPFNLEKAIMLRAFRFTVV